MCQFKSWKNCFQTQMRVYCKNVPAVAVPLDPLSSYIYILHETSCTCLKPRPSDSSLISWNINFPIIDKWSWSSSVPFYEKKTLWRLFSWMGLGCLKARMKTNWRMQFTFYHKLPEIAGTHFLSNSEARMNNANTKIWSKERSINPYVAKVLFP